MTNRVTITLAAAYVVTAVASISLLGIEIFGRFGVYLPSHQLQPLTTTIVVAAHTAVGAVLWTWCNTGSRKARHNPSD